MVYDTHTRRRRNISLDYVSHTVSEIFSVKEWLDLETGVGVVQGHWKWRHSIDHNTTFYRSANCIYSSYLVPILSYVMLKNIVTLKYMLEVIESHSNWYRSRAWVQFPICLP